ncbi:hypothetical protein M5D96_001576 [Drosophila gunungcola]|uniref:Uncharacterized protein n=1 Tax=Drosophila gunungcola TaxID=103775 RepID=A0A9Q0BV62_9MUSC|nr:hypothetical protein M5D96_001576 [Drosophila gunungcola]
MGLHPLGAGCKCADRQVDLSRTAAAKEEEFEPEPQAEMPHSDSVPALHEIRQEPRDPYYPNPPKNKRRQEVDPLANFDINRFDRDATHRAAGGPGGRRRKVSIRTCVDYDYEPEYPPREWPQEAPQSHDRHVPPQKPPSGYPPQQNPHRYPPQRSRPAAEYEPRTRPPPPSRPPSYPRRALPGFYGL